MRGFLLTCMAPCLQVVFSNRLRLKLRSPPTDDIELGRQVLSSMLSSEHSLKTSRDPGERKIQRTVEVRCHTRVDPLLDTSHGNRHVLSGFAGQYESLISRER